MVTFGRTANYSAFTNNCCPVVFEALRQVIDDKEKNKFNLSLGHININKRNYNFLGRGVSLAADDSFGDTAKGVGRFFVDTPTSLPKTGIHIVDNIYTSNIEELEAMNAEEEFAV
jgi:hypothetical protein